MHRPKFRPCAWSLCILAVTSIPTLGAQTTAIAPQGPYARIDTRLSGEAVAALGKGDPLERRKTVEAILANPQNYAPPAFYALSNVLASDGRADEGAFWFYFGQLRGRYDATRCADATARQAINALNQTYGPVINQYAFRDLDRLEALVPRVVEFDRRTAHLYDPRWINLHGMGAVLSGLAKTTPQPSAEMSLPENRWSSIAEETRQTYLHDFQEAIAGMRFREIRALGRKASELFPDSRVAALAEAACSGDVAAVGRMAASGVPVDSANADGATPLATAVFRPNLKGAEALLKLGADPNRQIKAPGGTGATRPIIYLVRDGELSAGMLELLLQYKLDPDSREPAGESQRLGPAQTLLQRSIMDSQKVKLLLRYGANVNLQGNPGHTAAEMAAGLGQLEALELLIDGGASALDSIANSLQRRTWSDQAKPQRLRLLRKLKDKGAHIYTGFLVPRTGKPALYPNTDVPQDLLTPGYYD